MARRKPSNGNARAGSARRGPAYPVEPKWQTEVRAQLERDGIAEKDFAKRIGCAQSTLHDLLHSNEARHSSLVPAIHRALKWAVPGKPEPSPPIYSPDALEMAQMYDRLPEEVRRSMRDQASAILLVLNKKPANPE